MIYPSLLTMLQLVCNQFDGEPNILIKIPDADLDIPKGTDHRSKDFEVDVEEL